MASGSKNQKKDKKKFVFQPGGSNIEAGLNYVINPHCFFGYFDGFKMNPFQIEVKKPSEMYGSGNLTKSSKDALDQVKEFSKGIVISELKKKEINRLLSELKKLALTSALTGMDYHQHKKAIDDIKARRKNKIKKFID